MYNFSVEISDAIESSFEGKLKASSKLCINNIECDEHIDGKALYDMTGKEVEKIRNLLIDYGKKIVLLSTSLRYDDMENLNVLFRHALWLNVEAIKVNVEKASDTEHLEKLSRAYGITVVFENNSKGCISDEKKMHELCSAGKDFELVFNPLEFVRMQRHPFFHVYYTSKIKNKIKFLRINDGLYNSHEAIMLHHGCAEVKELVSIMLSRSFKGYFSFTPYFDGMTLEQYVECIDIFKNDLKKM